MQCERYRSFMLSSDLDKQIRELASRRDRSVSAEIRLAITKHLEQQDITGASEMLSESPIGISGDSS